MNRTHQPDQSTFRAVLPEDIDWQPFPAFPSGARLAAGKLVNVDSLGLPSSDVSLKISL